MFDHDMNIVFPMSLGLTSLTVLTTGELAFLQKRKMGKTGLCKYICIIAF